MGLVNFLNFLKISSPVERRLYLRPVKRRLYPFSVDCIYAPQKSQLSVASIYAPQKSPPLPFLKIKYLLGFPHCPF